MEIHDRMKLAEELSIWILKKLTWYIGDDFEDIRTAIKALTPEKYVSYRRIIEGYISNDLFKTGLIKVGQSHKYGHHVGSL